MAENQSSVREVISDIDRSFPLDEGVIEDSRVLEACSFGKSSWARTARIKVQLSDGSLKQYFLKWTTEGGKVMMEGEFNSMTELHRLSPSFVPKPHAWGRFRLSNPVTHFFLCDFIDMENKIPEPRPFCARLAEIHLTSQSPTGQFGFTVPNCHGKILQPNDWHPSWTSYFTRLLVSFFAKEIETNGPWLEYEQAFKVVVRTVIPQLLDPVQAKGRVLKPSLVHGDLWEENAAINQSTGEPVVFDASAFYAHNEYELGTWRRELIKFGVSHFNEYFSKIHPSPPVEQWDDRIRLYPLKFNLARMIGWPKAPFMREEYVFSLA
ncbi:MAG: hypothetical protein Q9198_000553 [Flavoplaca austrocitrina]